MHKTNPSVLILFGLVCCLFSLSRSQTALEGIRKMYVEIGLDLGGVKNLNESYLRENIQRDTELRLRRIGLIVVDQKEYSADIDSIQMLNLVIVGIPTTVGDRYLGAAYTITAHVKEYVITLRDRNSMYFGSSWSSHTYISGSPPDKLFDGIKQRAMEVVDDFLNDYLKANPKTLR